jgi:GAF domain-containing protein
MVFELGDSVNAERASLFRVDEGRGEFRTEVARRESGKALEFQMPLDRGIVGHARATGEPVRVDDAYSDPRSCSDLDRASGYRTRSLLAVPICDEGGRVMAVIELLNRCDGAGFTGRDVARVRAHEPELRGLLAASA